MPQTKFIREDNDSSTVESIPPLTISVFADRSDIREAIVDDVLAVGQVVGESGDLALLSDRSASNHGEIVIVDCPQVEAITSAALNRLDLNAERTGMHLIVSTSVDAVDGVFGSLECANTTLLIDPTRGERVIALGSLLTTIPDMRLREMSDNDRISMLRLTEQVSQIAERLERMDSRGLNANGSAFRFESSKVDFHGEADGEGVRSKSKPTLPDPRLVRRIIRQRAIRAKFFDGELFADPAWNILLDLTAARAEHLRVSVSSLCIAAGVPPTTALRWITQMVETGLLVREEDEADRRRAFIALSDKAADAMARYFAELQQSATELI
ncbi:MAG: winged helix DNA-binding protein [Pontixanthobacter sp.]